MDTGEDDADVDADEEEFISIILHVDVYIILPFSKLELLAIIGAGAGGGRIGLGTLLYPWDSPTYTSDLGPSCGFFT